MAPASQTPFRFMRAVASLSASPPCARTFASAKGASPSKPAASSAPSFSGTKHFLTLRDFSAPQIQHLVRRSLELKQQYKTASLSEQFLTGKTLAMIFSKRSTRTRVSAESGWAYFGGHPMFLGKDDIQIGGGESLRDTAVVVSSMVDCIMARVGEHEEVEALAEHSTVPVINALTAKYHPLQILADLATMYEAYAPNALTAHKPTASSPLPPLRNLKVAWIGDANNILNSLLIALPRLGISISAATPPAYPVLKDVAEFAIANATGGATVEFVNEPVKAVKNADVVVTDTWVSMGQEAEKAQRLKEFAGFKVTEELGRAGGAKAGWKFMHCLPRKQEEVDDEVFYGPRSLVFPEAENRKYTVMAVYEMLMVNARQ